MSSGRKRLHVRPTRAAADDRRPARDGRRRSRSPGCGTPSRPRSGRPVAAARRRSERSVERRQSDAGAVVDGVAVRTREREAVVRREERAARRSGSCCTRPTARRTSTLAPTAAPMRRPVRTRSRSATGTASSGTNSSSSARASAASPHTAPSAATGAGVGRSSAANANSNAPTTARLVTVSDITSPSFTQMFGLTAAMPAATRPTVSPPTRRPEQTDEHDEHRAEQRPSCSGARARWRRGRRPRSTRAGVVRRATRPVRARGPSAADGRRPAAGSPRDGSRPTAARRSPSPVREPVRRPCCRRAGRRPRTRSGTSAVDVGHVDRARLALRERDVRDAHAERDDDDDEQQSRPNFTERAPR